jgi:hypothetical protein
MRNDRQQIGNDGQEYKVQQQRNVGQLVPMLILSFLMTRLRRSRRFGRLAGLLSLFGLWLTNRRSSR